MKFKSIVLAVCLVSLFSACDKDEMDDNELNSTDRTFMTNASISNTAEIGAGTLALTKASNPAVREFAQHMITEHTAAQAELKTLGTAINFQVRDSIDPAHITIMNQLSVLSGRAFDSAYIHNQVIDHQETVNLFDAEINSGNHIQVRTFANDKIGHIQMHLQKADSIAKSIFTR